jgi:hypothetical protein
VSPVALELACQRGLEGRTPLRVEVPARLPARALCRTCGDEHALRVERLTPGGGLVGCLGCGHPELYRAKRFPRALGIGVVVLAAALAPATSYLSLGAAAVLDLGLYLFLPDELVCYRCESRMRGFAPEPRHPRFDREIAERLRFGEKAVMGKPMRPGGTAGAPEPEH